MTQRNRAAFPIARPRRLRRTETLRRMVRETELNAQEQILLHQVG